MAILQCHFSLNLPQASRLLLMNKMCPEIEARLELAVGLPLGIGEGLEC